MLRWWRDFWDRFLNNEAYFVARVRSFFGAVAMLSVGFARNFAETTGWAWSERILKIAGAIGLLVALLMRAGDKTPESVKELAAKMESTR